MSSKQLSKSSRRRPRNDGHFGTAFMIAGPVAVLMLNQWAGEVAMSILLFVLSAIGPVSYLVLSAPWAHGREEAPHAE